jgi:hypothetical protein
LTKIKRTFPISPPGRKSEKLKNPFQRAVKIGRDHHPQTGQMAIMIDIMLTTPTAAPTDTNRGLYSSTLLVPAILGMIKLVYNIREIMIVYPAILIWKKSSFILGLLNKLWKKLL